MKNKVCTCCGKNKAISNFYYSSSYVNKYTETVQICKDCIFDYVVGDSSPDDMIKVKDILRMIDKPFIESVWKTSQEESKKSERNTFRTYMKNIAMPHNKDKSWKDSQFKEDIVVVKKEKVPEINDTVTDEQLKEWHRMWGEEELEGYLFMDKFYNEYMTKFPKDSPAQVNTYKSLAKIHWKAEQKLNDDEIKEWKELMDVSSKLHNDANIKPVQSKGVGEDKGLHCYGLWIADIEEKRPAEYFEDKKLYKDFDSLEKYFDKWVLRPFKNLFGKQRDFDVGDD